MFNLLNGQTSSARESVLRLNTATLMSFTEDTHSAMTPKACSVSKSTPVWKCKGPSMFNLSRFAASKCVPIKGQLQKHSKRKENARWGYTSCHSDKVDNDKIWYRSNFGVKEASTSKRRHFYCNAVFEILLFVVKLSRSSPPSVAVLTRFAASRCVQTRTLPKLATHASRTEAVCLCDETNEEAGPETQKDRAATLQPTNSGGDLTHVELVWQTHHDDNSTTRHMSTVLMVKVPSVLSRRHHIKEGRQAQYL